MWKLLIVVAVAFGVLNMASAHAQPAKDDVDFGPYLADLNRRIKRIPLERKGAAKVVVHFKVNSSGEVSDIRLVRKSDVSAANEAILHAIQLLAPRPLPTGANSPAQFQVTFDLTSTDGAAVVATRIGTSTIAPKQVKIDNVKTAIEQMHGFSMRFRPSGRSDGSPDLEAVKRDEIAKALRAGGAKSVQALARELKNPDLSMRKNASFELGELAGVYWSLSSLKDSEREQLTRTKIDITAAVPSLIEALKDSDFEVRVWSMSALSSLGPAAKAAIPALKQATKDKDPGIKTNAKAALAQIEVK